MTADELRARKAEIVRRHGPWTAHTIDLGHGVFTDDDPERLAGNARLIRRITQIAADAAGKPLNELRVLDLACLEGQYGIEFARHGADVVLTDVREAHLAKVRFAAEALGLTIDIRNDDIRNLNTASYGTFDVVLCIGILYHLDAPDVFEVIGRMAGVCRRLLIVDTHVAGWRAHEVEHSGRRYRAARMAEHFRWTTRDQRERNAWASIDNVSSVWLSRPSLVNALQDAGFTSVFACDIPAMPGRLPDRLTLAAIKGTPVSVQNAPAASLARADEVSGLTLFGRWMRRARVRLRAVLNAVKIHLPG